MFGKGQDSTLVFGGFTDVTMSTVEEWIATTLNTKGLESATKIYCKSNTFRGIMIAEFSDAHVANRVLEALAKSKPTISGKEVWCKKHRPIEIRVPMSLMLTLRRQLLDWGFSKADVRVKDETLTMTVGGKPVLHACVEEKELTLKWLDSSWEQWEELHKSPELQKIIDEAKAKLKNVFEKGGKGKGAGGKAIQHDKYSSAWAMFHPLMIPARGIDFMAVAMANFRGLVLTDYSLVAGMWKDSLRSKYISSVP